jgi:hypothetical protein
MDRRHSVSKAPGTRQGEGSTPRVRHDREGSDLQDVCHGGEVLRPIQNGSPNARGGASQAGSVGRQDAQVLLARGLLGAGGEKPGGPQATPVQEDHRLSRWSSEFVDL